MFTLVADNFTGETNTKIKLGDVSCVGFSPVTFDNMMIVTIFMRFIFFYHEDRVCHWDTEAMEAQSVVVLVTYQCFTWLMMRPEFG